MAAAAGIAMVAIMLGTMLAGGASGASSSTVVGATVPSATNISVAGCPPQVANRTDFGLVTPGSSSITSLDCSIVFGSSNDTASLLVSQPDGWGQAMWAVGNGGLDNSFGAAGVATVDLPSNITPLGFFIDHQQRLIVTGSAGGAGFVARLLPDGSPDLSFDGGGDGIRTYPSMDEVESVAIAPDDGMLLLGLPETTLHRIHEDGTDDTSCGGTGEVSWGSTGAGSNAGVVMNDAGEIVVLDSPTVYEFRLTKLTPTCGVDSTLTWADDGDGSPGTAKELVMDSAGRLLSVGTKTASERIKLCRTSFDLVQDASWGNTGSMVGCVTANLAGSDKPRGIHELSNGNVLVAAGSDGNLGLWTVSGATGAVVSTDYVAMGGTDVNSVMDVAVLPDDSLVGLADDADVRVGYVSAAHSLISTFGTGGIATHDAGGVDDVVQGPPIMLDGHIHVLAGDGADAKVLRIKGADVQDFADDPGDTTGNDWGTPGASLFGACLISGSNVSTGAGTWAIDAVSGADCADGDADPWMPIPQDSGAPGAMIARSAAANVANATVNLRFGLRAGPSQAPGSYLAPLALTVVAPQL
ncbi:MAG: hypothetical protein KDC46_00305 [Thermoleophilia bacterium]|nr:hypothetical protein [Thermoleophilia bacterium]